MEEFVLVAVWFYQYEEILMMANKDAQVVALDVQEVSII